MYKIGVIGDKVSIMGFMAVGFSVHEAENAEEAAKLLRSLAHSDYAVVYITEDLAAQIEEQIASYKDKILPAIITIPGRGGATGYGMTNLKKSVERAVGADILFKE